MATFHVATNTPTKPELLATWLPSQPWAPATTTPPTVLGSYHLDDPEGEVGMQGLILDVDSQLVHVPLTYRAGPLEGADDAFVGHMEHSVLGRRWVYDGMGDAQFLAVFAGVALTGEGEAIGLARHDGRWHVWPSDVRIQGGGWSLDAVAVDGFTGEERDATHVLTNDHFAMTVHRRLRPGPQPSIGLTATWSTQPDPVVVAEIRRLSR